MSEELVLMKIGGYRNYNSSEENIFEAQSQYTSNPIEIAEYLNSLNIKDGWGNEAMEIGL